eukprot:gene4005-734_t
MGKVHWDVFADGTPNVFVEAADFLRHRTVLFLANLIFSTTFFAQFGVMYALPRYYIKSLYILLPFFPTATMERVDKEGCTYPSQRRPMARPHPTPTPSGQIATASTLARMMSAVPPCSRGLPTIIIYDIHNLAERFFFQATDSVLPYLASAIPCFRNHLECQHGSENIKIAFPDAGARKRFGGMFEGFDVIVCEKVSRPDPEKPDAEGTHVFIVDDLVQSGGTLLGCQAKLLELGAKHVSCYCTHAVFPNNSGEKFVNSGIERFYITNSVPKTAHALKDVSPFHVLSITPSVVQAVSALDGSQ